MTGQKQQIILPYPLYTELRFIEQSAFRILSQYAVNPKTLRTSVARGILDAPIQKT